jgi:hypothetical protein
MVRGWRGGNLMLTTRSRLDGMHTVTDAQGVFHSSNELTTKAVTDMLTP